MRGSLARSGVIAGILFAGIVGACTPARREVQTDVVKSVKFKGNGGLFSFDQSDYLLSGAMEQGDSSWGVTVWPLLYWVAPEALEVQALDRDAWRLEVWYAHHGWFDARFDGWEIVRVRPRRKFMGGVVNLIGHVDPGPPSLVREFEVRGLDSPVHGTFRTSLLRTGPLQVGERFDLSDVDGAQDQVIDALGNHGFPYAEAKASIDAHPEETAVDVTLDVDPGRFAKFGAITFTGHDAVAERVIRDSVTFETGDTWDFRQLTKTQQSLFQLGTFAVVNVEPELSDPTRGDIPVEVSVTEAQFQTIRVGGGVSYQAATLTPRLSVEYRHNNLFHRLLQIRLKGTIGYGFRPQRGVAGLTSGTPVYGVSLDASTPYLGSPKVGLYVGGSVVQDIQSGQYTYFNPTARAGFTWRPLEGVVFSVGPEFELYEFRGLDAEGVLLAQQIFGPEFRNPYTLTKLTTQASWDRRDDPVNPTRGTYLGVGAEQALPFNKWVGGERGFLYTQVNADLRMYARPRLGRSLPFVGALRVQGKALLPWASNDYMPYSEKVFVGGATTGRGFLIDQIGPYDCICTHEVSDDGNGFGLEPGAGYDPEFGYLPKGGVLGGSVMGEVRYNFGGAQSIAFFTDVGLLIEKSDIYDASSLRFGAGVGYRYNTSIGPLRFDIAARPLYPEDAGPVDSPGCTIADAAGPRSFDIFGALWPKQRDLDQRAIPFALNLYIAIGEAF